jgi:hypothetical protein
MDADARQWVFVGGRKRSAILRIVPLSVYILLVLQRSTSEMPQYPIEKSILFVGYSWRTDMFSIHRNLNLQITREKSFADELKMRLSQVSQALPGRTSHVLLNMVTFIDRFEAGLGRYPQAVNSLGLGDTRPDDEPYRGCPATVLADLANTFLRAIIVDRILWALCVGTLEPFTQYIQDDFNIEVKEQDLARFHAPIKSIVQYLDVCEDHAIEYPDALSGDNIRCGISSVKHEGLGALHNIASQLYYAAAIFLLLGTVSEIFYYKQNYKLMLSCSKARSSSKRAGERVQVKSPSYFSCDTHLFSSCSSNPKIGANLRQLLIYKFQKSSTRELKPIFSAVTESILELLSEGYIEKKEKNKSKWGLIDFFKVFAPSSPIREIKL